MSKQKKHEYSGEIWNNKNEIKRQRQYARIKDNNECGNNLWQRKDDKTFVLLCRQTGERCNMKHCPCFNKQS